MKVLYLVQPSHHRGGATGPQGGQELSRVTLCVAESESGPRCPVPRPAVHSWPHAACDKCGSSILQAGILPRPSLFCTNLPRPPEEGTHCAESVSSSARVGRGARDPGPSQPPSFQGAWTCQSWRLRPGDGSRLPPLWPPSLLISSWLLGPVYWSHPS